MCSHDHIYNIIWVTWQNFFDYMMDRNCDIITFFQNAIDSRNPKLAKPCLLKIPLKTQN